MAKTEREQAGQWEAGNVDLGAGYIDLLSLGKFIVYVCTYICVYTYML